MRRKLLLDYSLFQLLQAAMLPVFITYTMSLIYSPGLEMQVQNALTMHFWLLGF
jgi:hypothetical protein